MARAAKGALIIKNLKLKFLSNQRGVILMMTLVLFAVLATFAAITLNISVQQKKNFNALNVSNVVYQLANYNTLVTGLNVIGSISKDFCRNMAPAALGIGNSSPKTGPCVRATKDASTAAASQVFSLNIQTVNPATQLNPALINQFATTDNLITGNNVNYTASSVIETQCCKTSDYNSQFSDPKGPMYGKLQGNYMIYRITSKGSTANNPSQDRYLSMYYRLKNPNQANPTGNQTVKINAWVSGGTGGSGAPGTHCLNGGLTTAPTQANPSTQNIGYNNFGNDFYNVLAADDTTNKCFTNNQNALCLDKNVASAWCEVNCNGLVRVCARTQFGGTSDGARGTIMGFTGACRNQCGAWAGTTPQNSAINMAINGNKTGNFYASDYITFTCSKMTNFAAVTAIPQCTGTEF